jgi:hypothetical protein
MGPFEHGTAEDAKHPGVPTVLFIWHFHAIRRLFR